MEATRYLKIAPINNCNIDLFAKKCKKGNIYTRENDLNTARYMQCLCYFTSVISVLTCSGYY